MLIEDFINSHWGIKLASFISRSMPLSMSYPISNMFAQLLIRQKNVSAVKTVRINQKVVRNTDKSQQLDHAVYSVFSHAGKCLIDLHRNMQSPSKIIELVHGSSEIDLLIKNSYQNSGGIILVTPHLSNFDLGLLSLACRGLQAQVLTIQKPNVTYQTQNSVRSNYGLNVTPIDTTSLHTALERLRNGGVIITGIDRPTDFASHRPRLLFFGKPAPMPTGYIRMAIKTGAKIVVGAVQMLGDGTYRIRLSEPIEMQAYRDRTEEVMANGEKILGIVEKYIFETPEQWLMFHPVWDNPSI